MNVFPTDEVLNRELLCPEWLRELHDTVTEYKGSIHFGQVCLERKDQR